MAKLPDDIRNIYTDAYKLHETFCDMANDAESWTKATNAANDMCISHDNHPFMVAMAIAVINQLERERKAQDGT